jgi:hypothetical protein
MTSLFDLPGLITGAPKPPKTWQTDVENGLFTKAHGLETTTYDTISIDTRHTSAHSMRSLHSYLGGEGVIFSDNRAEARIEIMRYLGIEESPDKALSLEEQGCRLLALADKYHSNGGLIVNRFERLSILNILRIQHRLIQLDEVIKYDKKGDLSDQVQEELRCSLSSYGKTLIFIQQYVEG